ncbi:MAG: winged helix-turn-helix domain-containing protein [Nitrososphaerales archaeon]
MGRRSRAEIIRQILQITDKGASTPMIMYKAYLSYGQLSEYLSFLIQNKMIKRQDERELYRVTKDGQRFYMECNEFVKNMEQNATRQYSIDTKFKPSRNRIHKTYRFDG